METAVADTCALVSLAIPMADATYDATAAPDPLQYLLTGCTVSVPTHVVNELEEMATYADVHAAAAANVLAAKEHYRILDPFETEEGLDSLPDHSLDDGEMAAIVLANAIHADALLTDEFTNLARIRALLSGPAAVPTPRLLRDYSRTGILTPAETRKLFATIAPHRSWDGNAYVEAIRETL